MSRYSPATAQPSHEPGENVVDLRRCSGRGEQEAKEYAHGRVPGTQPHVPISDVGDDRHQREKRNRDGHFTSPLPGSGNGTRGLAGPPSLAAAPAGAGGALPAAVSRAMTLGASDGEGFACGAHSSASSRWTRPARSTRLEIEPTCSRRI